MLIGHRYEHTPEGDLRIHSYNWVVGGLLLVFAGFCCTVAGVVFSMLPDGKVDIYSDPLNFLLLLLTILLLPSLGLVGLWTTGTRETLTLSRRTLSGERRTRMMFGLRTKVDAFTLEQPKTLELRSHKDARPALGQLLLVMRDGREQVLSPKVTALLPQRA